MGQELFDFLSPIDNWEEEMHGLPEYNNFPQPKPEITATFKFRNENDFQDFKEKVKEHIYEGQKVFDGLQRKQEKQAWYPLSEKNSGMKWFAVNPENPQYPIYIVSKGRWKRNPTSKALMNMNVPFYIIVEESEYQNYAELIPKTSLLVLPDKYKKDYDLFWKDGDKRTGPGPARNFAWDHSIDNNFKFHWVMDDNIESFERFNDNKKIPCADGTLFKIIEDFVKRYENIAQAGLGYTHFCPSTERRPAIRFNTRIYSCLFIKNSIPFRWRGRYNEDTDLSLRILKKGLCTAEFNMFLQSKRATQTIKGGNTAEFYENEGTLNKSKMLVDMHPDVTSLTTKFNRDHHHVDYRRFKSNKLQKKKQFTSNQKTHKFILKTDK